jgi:putative tricarboxylic transport membrane protein
MELLNSIIAIATSTTMILIIISVIIGLIFGAIPGLSGFTALTVFLPLTFIMNATDALSFMMGLFVGGCSGGLIASILLGIPGTAASVATCFDGYPMAQHGQAGKAIGIGILFSFLGGIFGAIFLVALGPLIAQATLQFGPYEYTAVILFALTSVSSLASGNILRGMLSCLLGILLGMVGMDRLTAYTRYTFGNHQFTSGFSLVSLLIGVFAISQVLENAMEKRTSLSGRKASLANTKIHGFGLSLKEFTFQLKNATPSALIGLVIGVLPGIGGAVSNLISYAYIKNRSKYSEKFGTGCVDGVVASETSNNAAVGGALIILMTLGIPGDSSTALILAGFQLHGIQPGPLLFKTSGALVYNVFAAFIIAHFVFLIIELKGIRLFCKVLSVPVEYLLPIIITFCYIGAFSANNRVFDIQTMIVFGFLGFAMKKFGYPTVPMIVGFILTPMIEENLRRSLMRSEGDFWPLMQSPIAAVFFILTIIVLVLSIRSEMKRLHESKKREVE